MELYKIDDHGFVKNAVQITSPNHDSRVNSSDDLAKVISLIVIHSISLPPRQYGGNGIIQLFTNALNPDEHSYYTEIYTHKVSSHFLIRRDGALIQFVSCLQRAWHAGVSNWQGRERCNDFSVGIELEGSDFDAFEFAQYSTLNQLIHAIKLSYPIEAVVGHSDIAPGRKTDPGPYFDWLKINSNKKSHNQ